MGYIILHCGNRQPPFQNPLNFTKPQWSVLNYSVSLLRLWVIFIIDIFLYFFNSWKKTEHLTPTDTNATISQKYSLGVDIKQQKQQMLF